MGIISHAAAHALNSSTVLIFLTLLLLAGSKRLSTCISLFMVQSAVIAAQVFAIAHLHHSTEAYLVGFVVVAVKVMAIPYVLFYLVRKLRTTRDVKASLSPATSVFIAAALILVSFSAVQSYAVELKIARDPLAAAVAIMLMGCFLMITRNKALAQIVGLLILENGIFMAALVTTFGMPLVIEIGVAFDLLIGVFLMGLFTFRIRESFADLDVSKLRRLRG
jgi:hydrogenase-4 component E